MGQLGSIEFLPNIVFISCRVLYFQLVYFSYLSSLSLFCLESFLLFFIFCIYHTSPLPFFHWIDLLANHLKILFHSFCGLYLLKIHIYVYVSWLVKLTNIYHLLPSDTLNWVYDCPLSRFTPEKFVCSSFLLWDLQEALIWVSFGLVGLLLWQGASEVVDF